jgi:GDP-mannose transporter
MKPNVEVTLSVLAYSACSGTLVLLNKLILHSLPYPSLVVSFQLVVAVAFIYAANYAGKLSVDPLQWEYVVPYLYYIIAFSLGVYCNMKSLSLSNVETVVVFRALSPCLVAVLDVLFLGREYPSRRSWMALSLIVLGAVFYASFDAQFQTQGWSAYLWPTAYLLIICFEMCYGKKIIQSVDLKTKAGPVLYTNLLGLPPMLCFAALGGEYGQFAAAGGFSQILSSFSSMLLLFLGCVAGTGIGFSSWWCRDQVSATSFTLIGVLNKCLTILLNCLIWDQHAAPGGLLGLCLCLVGGSLYQQSPLRMKKESESAKPEDEEMMEFLDKNANE